ncbi:TPA: hypothetical protein KDX42_003638 [Vibrio parahaemolyticus]|uniref:hypothetical protein n=1 Tax=Vibrio alginolyticus TaxID=663 RepID=UPI001EF12DD1|nr:hypothetical protein [Vibrio alginolyticus]MDF4734498.1 hypothetical protein [Vibrio parahaemolyticus]MDG2606609.1 hypothetical protein [Vibrio parahaemolyticus]ULF93513.1 hypothetical protein K6754_21665 [Vibrio alginolyticus]HBH7875419.1 hypothetical protein [Vibrio parahaemolyticus]
MNKLEFGNYTLKFGDKVLLDLFDEVVMPSFFEMRFKRKFMDTEYFFIDTKIVKLSEEGAEVPEIGICGRIVKNTKLKREQIFVGSELVDAPMELETAPSSSFLLILNNHRLIFHKEVAGAPTIDVFRTTSEQFLRKRHKEYIDELWKAGKERREQDSNAPRVTKVALLEDMPWPELRITPLTDKQNLNDFVNRFSQIDRLSIKLVPTNTEINNDDFWQKLETSKTEMNSPSTTISFSNTKDGLNSEEVLRQTRAATNLANSEIKLVGHDHNGDELNGDNEDFDLTAEAGDMPRDIDLASESKYKKFKELATLGTITLPAITQGVMNKITVIFNRL